MDKIKELLNKALVWWKNFSTKQRMIIISVMAAVLLSLGILAVIVSQPTMDLLVVCEDTAQAAEVKELLDGNDSINYEIESDNLTFNVDSRDKSDAALLLGSNNIPSAEYDINNVFDGGFSSTESDKNKKFQLYLENNIEEKLSTLNNIKSAQVKLSIPEDDGTIIAANDDTYASVIVELDGEMDEEQAAGLAKFIATAVGNDTTDNVLLMDSATNVLFSGGDSSDTMGIASSQLNYKSKEESRVKGEVKDVVLGSGVYDNVEIGMNLALDFSQQNSTKTDYSVDEGRDEGYIKNESRFESESEGGTAATPGTDTNDDNTTYMTQDGTTSSSSTTDSTIERALDEEVTNTIGSVGDIKYDESSLTVVANQYRIYDEATLKADGTLDGMTFDEFKAANDTRTKLEVDQDLYTAVATATGFPAESITIMAYEIPFFQYEDSSSRSITDYLPIILAVLIFAMLGFVVFKSTRKDAVADLEPELSVEALLETTREAQEQLEDIGFNEKSEARLLIEKFVDENPEAVASLLRNWLNEEWE